jgi:hypothetical protein
MWQGEVREIGTKNSDKPATNPFRVAINNEDGDKNFMRNFDTHERS